MKMKIGMAALVVSLPILMSPLALADIYTPGIEFCKQQGNPCGIDCPVCQTCQTGSSLVMVRLLYLSKGFLVIYQSQTRAVKQA